MQSEGVSARHCVVSARWKGHYVVSARILHYLQTSCRHSKCKMSAGTVHMHRTLDCLYMHIHVNSYIYIYIYIIYIYIHVYAIRRCEGTVCTGIANWSTTLHTKSTDWCQGNWGRADEKANVQLMFQIWYRKTRRHRSCHRRMQIVTKYFTCIYIYIHLYICSACSCIRLFAPDAATKKYAFARLQQLLHHDWCRKNWGKCNERLGETVAFSTSCPLIASSTLAVCLAPTTAAAPWSVSV